ncbi:MULTISPECIES: SanA/YdcF family protein [Larsenimonas]|uniref:ElyC/SanA/YdcF family protein n=1 Tax=Larsenimonas suaedae TaxID=1851019 RepID=A0ABU1GZL1_9GAMM|nr:MULTISPECIES: ElyC/SanA/YdcF family protein [Larsenimonas]MCM2972843.1 YdcF family protein [Larsenimonas suaedae]MCM5704790.1 YdcF family protein [Larsenimonas salina]MDR5896942.1 ElyC/SanA/YdcF family protein [Larsenimonas suaedae]
MKRLTVMVVKGGSWALMTVFAVLTALNAWVILSTRDQITQDALECPHAPVGVVFGTSYGLKGGGSNPHFHARIDTAAQLLRLGTVDHLLLSGDNRTRYYNEPRYMWRALHAQHVPAHSMTMDFAGFSTFETVYRAHSVFRVSKAVLITQDWHLPRALFIANHLGLDAYGCVAEANRPRLDASMRVREWLARAATVGDLFLWHRVPHFLGPALPIESTDN